MEFEVVVPWQVDQEARRVAAAFDVQDWKLVSAASTVESLPWQYEGTNIEWEIGLDGNVFSVQVGDPPFGAHCDLYFYSPYWALDVGDGKHTGQMACGLYRLGFSDEYVLSQLPQLTAHEKLELRLSMPREFWPQKWLDEEAK